MKENPPKPLRTSKRGIQEQLWALITPKGEVVETFHAKDTATYWRPKLEKIYLCKLNLKYIG